MLLCRHAYDCVAISKLCAKLTDVMLTMSTGFDFLPKQQEAPGARASIRPPLQSRARGRQGNVARGESVSLSSVTIL